MDNIDRKILTELVNNARVTGAEIARKVHLSLPAITERLRKLDQSGWIDQYTIKLNRDLFDLKTLAFIKIWLDHSLVNDAKEYLLSLHEVLECHHIAGEYDLLLKVLVKDTAQLENLLGNKIKTTQGVTRTSTTIVLSSYKEDISPKSF